MSNKKEVTSYQSKSLGYPKPAWAIKQVVRLNGLVEDVCEHGCSHPNESWIQKNDPYGKKGFSIHGCDGCCSEFIQKLKTGKIKP